MSKFYELHFLFDGLTEDEMYQLVKRMEVIKDHIYPELDIVCTGLHRENRVSVDQVIPEDCVFELYRLLCNVSVDKVYDDYYGTGVDSRLVCCLRFVGEFPL